MKILTVVDGFEPQEVGGITKSLLSELEDLQKKGHQLCVVAKKMQKNTPSHEKINNLEIFRYHSPVRNSVFYRLYPLFSLLNLPKVPRLFHNGNQFDLAYVHNSFQIVALHYGQVKFPLVYNFHAPMHKEIEIDAHSGKYGFLKILLGPLSKVVRLFEKRALRKSNIIIVHSEFMKSQLETSLGISRNDKRIELVPLCVDTDRFKFTEDPVTVRKKLSLPQDRLILLTVRRLVARMGLENLIEAMEKVKESYPKILLLIGGKGYLKEALQKKIFLHNLENQVKLLGFIPDEILPHYYQAADLFVLPTTELEGFGLATIEALSCGTPVIGTPVGATPEVIGPLRKEFLCQDSTPQALAERILWWLDKGLSPRLRQECREYCVSRFHPDKVVNQLEKIFNEVIQK